MFRTAFLRPPNPGSRGRVGSAGPSRPRTLLAMRVALALVTAVSAAAVQAWPDKPVRVVVPGAASAWPRASSSP